MPLEAPIPSVDDMMAAIGEAGLRLSDIGAIEGAAGNISVFFDWPVDPGSRFTAEEAIDLPVSVPALARGVLLVTGSGRRLRETLWDPVANLGMVVVNKDGRSGRLFSSPRRLFDRLTSEFNSHLAVHQDQVVETGAHFHAVVHAQPVSLTYLSHVPPYQAWDTLSRRLLRWQPETVLNLPEGIGCIPFLIPGSAELAAASVESLRSHRIVVWSKHGVMARSDRSVKRAVDRIEYAETAARYECLNLRSGEAGQGLSDEEIRRLCRAFGIQQQIF